jgi:ribosomal protein S19
MKRSKWKGLFIEAKDSKNLVLTQTKIGRSSSIVPKFVGQKFKIHNGNKFKSITIIKEMLGHKFGEFARTRMTFQYKKKKKKKKK